MESAFSADALYGGLRDSRSAPMAAQRDAAPETGGDPHDKADKGPAGFWDDPVVWLCLIAAIGAGVIGFRFHWGPGVSASARVDVSDEAASVVGHAFLTMAIIVVFKIVASKLPIKALQTFAAAI